MFKLSAALMAVAIAAASAALGQTQERCYGVALAGQNDGIDRREAPGSATEDYQGNAWVWFAQGRCLTTALPVQTDGTPRRGSLEPLERDLPDDEG